MENLAPVVLYISTVCFGLENGISFRNVLNSFVRDCEDPEFTKSLMHIVSCDRLGETVESFICNIPSPSDRAALELTSLGLSGESVLFHFKELQEEVDWLCDQSIEEHLRLLPLKTSLPVLLLLVPAFLLLLFGPLLSELIRDLQ
ncbi:MAG: hypothetical protein KDD61_10920 [Bdellovibrionales bacterium]|nr:hypothetical protein [Bdellovibrionales bacterium]